MLEVSGPQAELVWTDGTRAFCRYTAHYDIVCITSFVPGAPCKRDGI